MFTKLAQFLLLGLGRPRRPLAIVARNSDIRPEFRNLANSHQARRPTLICGWRKVPSSGALECRWQAIDVPEADELAQRRHGKATPSPTACATGKRSFARAAA
jgi:hypothetical protein